MKQADKITLAGMALLCACLLPACNSKTQIDSRCRDRVAEQCGPIAQRECDLSTSSSASELEKCIPYASCENLTMMGCVSQQ